MHYNQYSLLSHAFVCSWDIIICSSYLLNCNSHIHQHNLLSHKPFSPFTLHYNHTSFYRNKIFSYQTIYFLYLFLIFLFNTIKNALNNTVKSKIRTVKYNFSNANQQNLNTNKLCFVIYTLFSPKSFDFKIQATSTDKPVSPNYALGNGVGTGGTANLLIRLGLRIFP